MCMLLLLLVPKTYIIPLVYILRISPYKYFLTLHFLVPPSSNDEASTSFEKQLDRLDMKLCISNTFNFSHFPYSGENGLLCNCSHVMKTQSCMKLESSPSNSIFPSLESICLDHLRQSINLYQLIFLINK